MPRPSRPNIEAHIVDHAAALFARHSFQHTSLQQIADALDYSKAGVLHHYPSKQHILDAVLATTRAQIATLIAGTEHTPPGIERDRALVSALITLTYEQPGIAAFGAAQIAREPISSPELLADGEKLFALFAPHDAETPTAHQVRIIVALGGLTTASLEAVRSGMTEDWHGPILEAALRALGYAEADEGR